MEAIRADTDRLDNTEFSPGVYAPSMFRATLFIYLFIAGSRERVH